MEEEWNAEHIVEVGREVRDHSFKAFCSAAAFEGLHYLESKAT